MGRPKKIMLYSRNIYGFGSDMRMIALLTGMRRLRPDIDFLVVSGTCNPQLFLKEGFDIIRVPSIHLTDFTKNAELRPKFLKNSKIDEVIELREKIILSSFDAFNPDVLIVEHDLIGLCGEILPILLKKWRKKRNNLPVFKSVFVSRGIIQAPWIIDTKFNYRFHQSESIDILQLYDRIYIFEDKKVINMKTYWGPQGKTGKVKYLGKITTKSKAELVNPVEVSQKLNLPAEKKLILVSMGRGKTTESLVKNITKAFHLINSDKQYILWIQPDQLVYNHAFFSKKTGLKDVIFSGYALDFIDLINAADLIICRAGYGTYAEILQTNSKAILVPNARPNKEQEYRAKTLPSNPNILVMKESALGNTAKLSGNMLSMLAKKAVKLDFDFNKYKIAKKILTDLKL